MAARTQKWFTPKLKLQLGSESHGDVISKVKCAITSYRIFTYDGKNVISLSCLC